jgi:hypothetical protein
LSPPIIPEKVFFTDENSELVQTAKIEDYYDDSFTRSSEISNIEKAKSSFDYIKNFHTILPDRMKKKYFDFLSLNKVEKKITQDKYGRFYYDEYPFFLIGVIFNYQINTQGIVTIDSMFKVDINHPTNNMMWEKFENTVSGKGETIENAFFDAFTNWLEVHGINQTMKVKEKIRRTMHTRT